MATLIKITGSEKGGGYEVTVETNDDGPSRTKTESYSSWDEVETKLRWLGVPRGLKEAREQVDVGRGPVMNFPDGFLHFPPDFFN